MNATDEKWDKLVESLRRAEPVLDEPEALTDRIMQQIDRPADPSTFILMNWVRLISCSAAAFFLGLFVFQQRENPGPATGTPPRSAIENTRSACSQEVRSFTGRSVVSQPAQVREAYFCYLKQHAIQNTKFRSYYQPSID